MSNIGVASKSGREKPSWPNRYLRQWIIPFLIVAITVITFYPALKNAFVNWDDDKSILENPFYRGLHWTNLRWMFSTFHMGHYQPLSWLSFSFDYLLWGVDPFGYHLTNILLHSANAVLFYYLSRRLLRLSIPGSNGVALNVAAAFAALVFAIHPLRAESVAWATERRDVLSGFFLLLTVLTYLKAVSGETDRRSWWRWIVLAVVLYGLSLLSKASGMTLPFVLVVLDVYPLRRLGQASTRWFGPEARNVWLEKIPFFVLGLSFGVIALIAQYYSGALKPLEQYALTARLAQALYGVIFYLWKTVLPFSLSPLYEIPAANDLWNWRFLISGFVAIAISAVLVAFRRRYPAVLACWVSYVIILTPTLGFAQSGPQLVADRYTYLACLSWATLAGGAMLWVAQQWDRGRIAYATLVTASGFSLALLVFFGVLTWKQAQIWKDSERLWRHALAIQGESAYAHNNLGMALAEQNRLDEAILEFRDVLRIDPLDTDGHYNLGNALARRGRLREAVEQFHEVLRILPEHAKAHYDLGNALARQGDLENALVHLREALRYSPRNASAHYNAGRILLERSRLAEAMNHFRQALSIDAAHVKARYYLAVALAEQGDFAEATAEFQKALRVDPELAEAHAGLARVLSAQGKKDQALQHYQEAVRLLKSQGQSQNEAFNK